MAKVIKYKVVKESSYTLLEDALETRLSDGWQPLGGLSVAVFQSYEEIWAQTVVKYEAE